MSCETRGETTSSLKMRCCAPFCRNTPDNVLASGGKERSFSFHGFPSDAKVRAAWLRALGKQDAALADPAVVCSQHFLEDDICETESGLRQIDAGAIPSTVLVCMMCLDTDSKLILMRKHKLEEAYGHLTGYAPCSVGNLKQTLCVQCTQRLMNFSRFRDRSLRARALMMDLVEKHELITRRHIKMINRTKHGLRSPLVVKTLGADFCDLHIQEDMSEDKHTESETTINISLVKTEEGDDSMAIREDMDMVYEDDDFAGNVNNEINEDYNVNNEINEDYIVNNEINEDYNVNNEINEDYNVNNEINEDYNVNNEINEDYNVNNEINEDYNVNNEINEDYNVNNEINEDYSVNNDFVALDEENVSDVLKCERVDFKCSNELVQDLAYMEASVETSLPSLSEIKPDLDSLCDRGAPRYTTVDPLSAISTDSAEHLTEGADAGASSERAVSVSGDLDDQSSDNNNTTNDNIDRYTNCIVKLYDVFGKKPVPKRDASLAKTRKVINSCDIQKVFKKKSCKSKIQNEVSTKEYTEPALVKEQVDIPVSLQSKADMFKQKSLLVKHVQSHETVNRFTCDICQYKFKLRSQLTSHLRVHTSKKSFSCGLCDYKSANKSRLKKHMKIHTVEKPYSCKFCEFKTECQSNLRVHKRQHTGEKPYSCSLCDYKSVQKSRLVYHMRTHTGEKPFSCKLCEYKTASQSNLQVHKSHHTGEKPYSCSLCDYKSVHKSRLVYHMRTHTGEKPYSCELCEYKTALSSNLRIHKRQHTGEKPYCCTLCDYKSVRNSDLVVHIRTHTGEKPYSCRWCDYKSITKRHLRDHMLKHVGEKPYSCSLCDYKSVRANNLVVHMRTHTGEKPYSCKLCDHKFTRKYNLTAHMKRHR